MACSLPTTPIYLFPGHRGKKVRSPSVVETLSTLQAWAPACPGPSLPSLTLGCLLPRPPAGRAPTIGDEGPVTGWMKQEVFLSRDHTVEVLIVVLMHCQHRGPAGRV